MTIRQKQWIFVLAITAIIIAAYLRFAPPQYDIRTPIDLTAPPTFVTEMKLRFGGEEACFEALDRAGVVYERLPNEMRGPGCNVRGAARLGASTIDWGDGVELRCPMLAGVVMWELHHVQPAAQEWLSAPVERIRHYGSYSCRNINNAAGGSRSQHAFANAIDIAGFQLADGREISVARDWGKSAAEGRFLKAVRNRACRRFNTVLSPDYNALHKDHFHFDNGRFMSCR